MNRLAIPIVGLAFLAAACGGAAIQAKSANQPQTIAGTVQVNGGANAGSDLSDLGRANPTVRKGGTIPAPPAPPRPAGTNPAQPAGASRDRCQTGAGTGASTNSGAPAGKRLPLPMCLPE